MRLSRALLERGDMRLRARLAHLFERGDEAPFWIRFVVTNGVRGYAASLFAIVEVAVACSSSVAHELAEEASARGASASIISQSNTSSCILARPNRNSRMIEPSGHATPFLSSGIWSWHCVVPIRQSVISATCSPWPIANRSIAATTGHSTLKTAM